jgi:hypothetical protein
VVKLLIIMNLSLKAFLLITELLLMILIGWRTG